jgi:cellulose synthase/poly-beta-1,6-N-acetylglucosamine synthase-like glycosyltransferase
MSPPLVVVSALALVAPCLALALTWRAAREWRSLGRLEPAPLTQPLLVVIPARNEAERLPATLDRLLNDDSPCLRVVVVDDASTDGTAAIVEERARRDARVTLRRPSWPPATDLFGKPRALDDGIRADPDAHALILCLDADVHLGRGALGALVAAIGDAAALSAMPRLDDVTLVERALVPAFVAAVGATHPPSAVHDPASPVAFLNGQVMLLRREALDAVGGFASVSHSVLEDVALARRLKAAGQRLALVDGRDLFATRMYDGFGAIVQGFGKNARALHGAALWRLGLGLPLMAWLPWLVLAAAALTDGATDERIALAGLLVTTFAAASNRRTLGSSPWWALLSPLVMTVVGAVYLRAAIVRRGQWRGRTFST